MRPARTGRFYLVEWREDRVSTRDNLYPPKDWPQGLEWRYPVARCRGWCKVFARNPQEAMKIMVQSSLMGDQKIEDARMVINSVEEA